MSRRRISRALIQKVFKEITALEPLRHPRSSAYQAVERHYLQIRKKRDAGYSWEQIIADLPGVPPSCYVPILTWYRELSEKHGLPYMTRSLEEQAAHQAATKRWAVRQKR
ncbi:MAG: hypothetical protein WCE83_04940 [Candidatus Baltobacteraceae bacterium]